MEGVNAQIGTGCLGESLDHALAFQLHYQSVESIFSMSEVQMSQTYLKISVGVIGHIMGMSIIASFFAALYVNELTMRLFVHGLGDAQLRSELIVSALLVFVLSGVLWGLLFMGYSHAMSRRSGPQVMARPVGAIMTETIIVFPVFLLLLMGMSALGQRSMAGLLTTLGTYQAARTLSVWAPEIGYERLEGGPVTTEMARDRARIAVAVTVTPTGSELASQQGCGTSEQFDDVILGMGGAMSGVPIPALPKLFSWSFIEAWGTATFASRYAVKLRAAYCQTSVDFDYSEASSTTGSDFDTSVTYRHRSPFPLVSRIFDNETIERTYTLRSHIPPNDALPLSVVF